ncbi:hypothetical protein EAF04_005523 [Stromatinia cepivora]|nr:hypothetical protein EAF04_005523 [Stromatinia cepivora]
MSAQSSSISTTTPASMVTSAATSLSFKFAGLKTSDLGSKTRDLSSQSLCSPPEKSVLHPFSSSSDSGVVLCSKLFYKKYAMCKTLGEGTYGWISSIEEKTTKKKFAVKIEKINPMETLQHEWELQRHLNHPSIVRVYDYYEGQTAKNEGGRMVMELGEKNMLDILGANGKWYIEEAPMKAYFKDVLLGLQYLKSQNIVHRDIKLENILLGCDSERRMKLTDFGFSQKLEPGQRICKFTGKGTLPYNAPECFAKDAKIIGIGLEVDIWAAGVLLFECLKGYPPFSGDEEDGQKGFRKIKQRIKEYRFIDAPSANPPKVSREAEDLIMGMLKFNFNERWTVEQCLEHPWITGHPPL